MKDCLKEKIFSPEFTETLNEDYRFLHAHAETGFELYETIGYVRKRLEEIGLSPKACGKCGLVVTLGEHAGGERSGTIPEGMKEQGAFLVRADMDALPIAEESGLSYAAKNGNMHACGHDAHTAILLGVASVLKQYEKQLRFPVKLMFQPAEELLAGAKDMLEAGVLSEPEVEKALMLHVMCAVPVETGTLVVSNAGVSAPAADFYTIEIKGKGCHASMPHLGKDPLTTAAHLLVALEEIKAREIEIGKRAVLTIGALEGANAANVIPDKILLKGSLRAFEEETRELMKKRLQEIAEGMGEIYHTPTSVEFTSGAPTLKNDEKLVALCYEALKGAQPVLRAQDFPAGNSGGSEDFAYVSQAVPSVMLALAAGDSREGYEHPLHHPCMKLDLRALPYGVAGICRIIAGEIRKEDFLKLLMQ